MSAPSDRGRLLALAPEEAQEALAAAATAAGLSLARVPTVGALLSRLQDGRWDATLVSFSADHVDERLVARLGDEGRCGSLLLSTPAVTLQRAVAVERAGALALLREPLDEADLATRLAGVANEGPEVIVPPVVEEGPEEGPVLVGDSPEIARVVERIARVARSDSTVLVTGESGTGKEVVARSLHWASERRRGPFVAVNCAAIPEHLLESELFGHERGAFTGAVQRRVGRVERAAGGTLFLVEIGDMSVVLQAKVLRALEERCIEPVGGERERPVDVRVVAATNQDLAGAIADGSFREDLYYRLAVVELHLPPLRQRGGDVRALALHFAGTFARRHDRPIRAITRAALRRLEDAPWPGNVRELRNVIDRAVLMAHDDVIRSADLRIGAGAPRVSPPPGETTEAGYAPTRSLQEVEADHIRRVLASVDGQIGRAATTLGIHRNTLARKVREYGIEPAGDGGGP